MGIVGGGVWVSKDGGNSWLCIFDGYFGGLIGVVVVVFSDFNVIYVGEGEQIVWGNVFFGNGLWCFMDVGEIWSFIGFKGIEYIVCIIVYFDDLDIVYVVVMGNFWIFNEE